MSNADSTRKAQALGEAVKSLASPQQKIALQKRLGQAAVAQAQLGVRQGRDPYGTPWKPLTSRNGRPLRRTGNNIQRSWTAGAETPDTFTFGSRFKYLATHQYGAVIKAKPGKVLRFTLEGGGQDIYGAVKYRVGGTKGKTHKGGRYATGWGVVGNTGRTIYAMMVKIPRRQLVPEMSTGGLGSRWLAAFSRVTRRFLLEVTGGN